MSTPPLATAAARRRKASSSTETALRPWLARPIIRTLAYTYPALRLVARHYEWVDMWPALMLSFTMTAASGWILYATARWLRLNHHEAFLVSLVGSLLIWGGSDLTELWGIGLALAAAILLMMLAGWVAFRLRGSQLIGYLNIAAITFLALTVGVDGLSTTTQIADRQVQARVVESDGRPVGQRTDVLLVVLDGYPRLGLLERDFGYRNAELLHSLEVGGFEVPDSVWAPSAKTLLSISSLIDLETKAYENLAMTAGDVRTLSQIMGGSGVLFDTFRGAGYQVHYVESGWAGTRCRDPRMVCYPAPIWGEVPLLLLGESIFAPVQEAILGGRWTPGARNSLETIPLIAREIAADSQRDLLFAHVVAPHWPFTLDADCEVAFPNLRPEQDGAEEAYLSQTQCVDRFIAEIAQIAVDNPRLAVLIISDHGSEFRGQMLRDPSVWDRLDIEERMTVFAALRLPAGCSAGPWTTSIEATFLLASCVMTDVPPTRETGAFIAGVVVEAPNAQVPQEVVDSITESIRTHG